MLVSDYHNHPQAHRNDLHYRPEVLDPWAKRALGLGLKDLALTDHDRYKDGVDFDEIDKLRNKYPELEIRSGIELDNDPETSKEGRLWVEKNWDKLDFVLGSIHFVKDFPFDHPHYIKEYENYDINELYSEYYKNIREIACSGLVDAIGHLDLIKIFKFFPTVDMSDIYHETLNIIKAQNLSIEINTAGLRKPIGEIYPSREIIAMAKDKNISFTISSDAHTAADLSLNYDKLESLLQEMQIFEIAVYCKHQKTMVKASL